MFRHFSTLRFASLVCGILFLNAPLAADISTESSLFVESGLATYDVDTEGPRQGGDYYASGNDDAFGEYGITTFNLSPSDFGGEISDIFEVALTLTVHGRDYADGGTVEFFFSSYTGPQLSNGGGDFSSLVYDRDFDNGMNHGHFPSAPVSLGTFDVEATNSDRDGEQDTFVLAFEGAALSELISALNNGRDFQILIAAGTLGTDVTYAGANNYFGLGGPTINISAGVSAVPEPTGAIAFCVLGLAALYRRRR